MRVLITGASGLLGINLAIEAAKQHRVFGTTHQTPLRNCPFDVLQADLSDSSTLEPLFQQARPDWVINCAALAVLDTCEAQPDLANRMNSELPANLARLSGDYGARFVHISTDAVFDGAQGNYSEEDPPNPLGVYAQSKVAGEKAVMSYPDTVIARVNFYGCSLSGRRSLAEWFLTNLQSGSQMSGFTDVYFCPLLANHLGGILLEMLERKLSGLYHVVSSETISKYDFGVALAKEFGLDPSLIHPGSVSRAGLAARRSPTLSLNIHKLQNALGRRLPSIREGLQAFHEQYLAGYPAQLQSFLSHGTRR